MDRMNEADKLSLQTVVYAVVSIAEQVLKKHRIIATQLNHEYQPAHGELHVTLVYLSLSHTPYKVLKYTAENRIAGLPP